MRFRRRGSAAANSGEALPHRHTAFNLCCVEAELRRIDQKGLRTVCRRLTAMCGAKGANWTCWLLTLFLLSALSFLPAVFSQNQTTQPTPVPAPSPAPSPSPSPTPPPNLHHWGAVTSFHGLPSDRTH